MKKYFYLENNQQTGPFTTEELKESAKELDTLNNIVKIITNKYEN